MSETVPLRDLRIAENKNVAYRKQVTELRDLLSQANRRAELLRHGVEKAKSIGTEHVKHAATQMDILHGQFSKCRKVIDAFIEGIEDPSRATEEVIDRKYALKTVGMLTQIIGHEVQE